MAVQCDGYLTCRVNVFTVEKQKASTTEAFCFSSLEER